VETTEKTSTAKKIKGVTALIFFSRIIIMSLIRFPEKQSFLREEGERVKKSCQWQVFSKRTGAICDCGPAPTGE